jgi:hypothetical protein
MNIFEYFDKICSHVLASEDEDGAVLIDMVVCKVCLHPQRCQEKKAEFLEVLKAYPNHDRLQQGPSYIEIGAEMESQQIALFFMAIGSQLGFWSIITPITMGATDPDEIRKAAGAGFVMISPKGNLKQLAGIP